MFETYSTAFDLHPKRPVNRMRVIRCALKLFWKPIFVFRKCSHFLCFIKKEKRTHVPRIHTARHFLHCSLSTDFLATFSLNRFDSNKSQNIRFVLFTIAFKFRISTKLSTHWQWQLANVFDKHMSNNRHLYGFASMVSECNSHSLKVFVEGWVFWDGFEWIVDDNEAASRLLSKPTTNPIETQ